MTGPDFVLALLLQGATTTPVVACLHDSSETTENQTRRQAALIALRKLNTAQAQMRRKENRLLSKVELPPAPDNGFLFKITTEGSEYVATIRDSKDPCGFVYTTDETGLISEGVTITTPRSIITRPAGAQ